MHCRYRVLSYRCVVNVGYRYAIFILHIDSDHVIFFLLAIQLSISIINTLLKYFNHNIDMTIDRARRLEQRLNRYLFDVPVPNISVHLFDCSKSCIFDPAVFLA